MKKGIVALSLIILLIAVAGCGKKTYQPQAINEDIDVCIVCNMQVKDDAFATQIITKEGKSLKFDDIGCMNEWKKQHGTDNIGMEFVRDYNDKEWIEYGKATFVYDTSIRTPMAYGLISFNDKKSAEQFIQEQGVGQLLSAEELANHHWEQSGDMMDMHTHDEDHSHSHDDPMHEGNSEH